MRRWPRKIMGFCNVNPLDPAAPGEVERCLAAGFRGVGELAWYVDDPGEDLEYFLTPLAELSQQSGLATGRGRMPLPRLARAPRSCPRVWCS